MVPAGESLRVVTGIGINVRLPPAVRRLIDQRVCDLRDVTGRLVSRNALLAALINRFAACLDVFRDAGFAAFRDTYAQLDCLRGRNVVVSGGEYVSGIARGVNASGELIIETANGLRSVRSGDVSVRPAAGRAP